MTTTEPAPPPVEHEPDHELDRQAWADGYSDHRPTRPDSPLHDAHAEEALLGAMLLSIDACDTVINLGLDASDFYSPTNASIYTAIIDTLAADELPDPITVWGRLDDMADPRPLVNLQSAAPGTRNAWSYARRITACAQARRLQGHALEVAQAAATGNIDEALRQLDRLHDALPTEDATSTWTPIDIGAIVDGDTTGPVPTVLAVTGSVPLFYTGRTNAVFGESGAGKTWVGLAAIVEAVAQGHDAMVIDFEDTAAGLVSRLQLLGLTGAQIRQHFIYIQPDLAWSPAAQAQVGHVITARAPAVVLIDSTGEAMAIDGVKGNDDDDVARWFTTFPKFIARLGPAVILTDHIPKATDAPQLYQIGSQRKRAAIDGASYRIDALKEPSRTTDGLLVATTAKDRHGHHTKGQRAAQISLAHDHHDETVTLSVAAPETPPTDDDGNTRYTVFMERISELLEDGMARSGNAIEGEIRGKAKSKREALRCLVVEGYVTATAVGSGFSYRSQKPFRADEDPVTNPPTEEASDDI